MSAARVAEQAAHTLGEPGQPVHADPVELLVGAQPGLAQRRDRDMVAALRERARERLGHVLLTADDRCVELGEHQDPHRGLPEARR